MTCPTCKSTSPTRHPADVRYGGFFEECPDQWHKRLGTGRSETLPLRVIEAMANLRDAIRRYHMGSTAGSFGQKPAEWRDVLIALDALDAALANVAEVPVANSAPTFALTERNADTLDAERYRFLRDISVGFEEDSPSVCSGLSDLFKYHDGPEVDEVVDAAMARWKAAGGPVHTRTVAGDGKP